ncbi:hypothetical protein D7V91_01715 [bacterium 1xD42-67]|nr:hypothetical protein D7V91_01715 [bacterium 1xD42-67]
MDAIQSLFLNDTVIDEIETFCANDPELVRRKQRFYSTADEIAKLAGHDLYDAFEKSLGDYLYRTADLYYLYGLGLRQEIFRTLGTGG